MTGFVVSRPILKKQFNILLVFSLFQEGLLDRHEFLTSFIEILEKYKQTDDTILKLTLAQILQVTIID